MSDVTCAEFGRIMAGALDRMDAEWRSRRAASPDRYPERLEIRDWWTHFSTVVMPDLLVTPPGPATQPSDAVPKEPAATLEEA